MGFSVARGRAPRRAVASAVIAVLVVMMAHVPGGLCGSSCKGGDVKHSVAVAVKPARPHVRQLTEEELNLKLAEVGESEAQHRERIMYQAESERQAIYQEFMFQEKIASGKYQPHGVVDAPNSIKRVVSWGDLHGDKTAFSDVMVMAGVKEISEQEAERFADTLFVTTGDYMDRGPDDVYIYTALKRMLAVGFNVRVVTGNHESMVATGDWRYRGMSRLKSSGEVKAAMDDCMSCAGGFNKWVRDVTTPVLMVKHPAHTKALLYTHGGLPANLGENVAGGRTTTTFQGLATLINRAFSRAVATACGYYDQLPHSRRTVFRRNTRDWDDNVSNGATGNVLPDITSVFNDLSRSMCTPKGAKCDPTWDRTLVGAAGVSDPKVAQESCTEWYTYYTGRFTDLAGGFTHVVGHTPFNPGMPLGPRPYCAARLFNIDTAASKGLAGRNFDESLTGNHVSILVFENFGDASWATNPVITMKYSKKYGRRTVTCAKLTDDQFVPAACL